MTVAVVGRAVASRSASSAAARSGAGKVIDVTPTASRPLKRTTSTADKLEAGATGYSLGKGSGSSSRSSKGSTGGSSAISGNSRRLLVAEFTLCMVVLAFSPLTDKHKSEKPSSFMKRASATMGVFFVLGLISTAGKGASKAAAGFGGLMTLSLLISQRSIFSVLTGKLGRGVGDEDDAYEGIPKGIGSGSPSSNSDDDEDDDFGQAVPDSGTRPTPGLTPLFPGGISIGAGFR